MKKTAGVIFRTLILLLLGITIGMLIGDKNFADRNLGFSFSGADKISKVLQLVDENYVDSVNIDSIEGASVNQLLQNLDPHSLYLPPQQAQSINERLDGGFNGIGIEYQLLRDTLIITQYMPVAPQQRQVYLPGTGLLMLIIKNSRVLNSPTIRLTKFLGAIRIHRLLWRLKTLPVKGQKHLPLNAAGLISAA
ncbi:hypothetical protein SAMN05216464_10925 [Mucilaginibacter pineti]|uniref:Uncharacterized protein n=1 Tax=Mucilaginibacter pineti TaxID=1391627 RepID=A0A1G7FEV5_9SPHI|nr:hypothetical protein SAMN05216464_10925 [Mucilaginibacter pineti]